MILDSLIMRLQEIQSHGYGKLLVQLDYWKEAGREEVVFAVPAIGEKGAIIILANYWSNERFRDSVTASKMHS